MAGRKGDLLAAQLAEKKAAWLVDYLAVLKVVHWAVEMVVVKVGP